MRLALTAFATLAVVSLTARPAAAQRDWGTILLIVGGVAVLPSEVGADLVAEAGPSTRFVLGWSYQFALDTNNFHATEARHRIVTGVDLRYAEGDTSARARVGYRYARRWLFGGAGASVDNGGITLSPELGVKFTRDKDDWVSPHLLVRGEVAADLGRFRGATILLGWSLM